MFYGPFKQFYPKESKKIHVKARGSNDSYLTSGFTPVALYFVISIRLVADKPFRPFFDDGRAINWPYCHFVEIFVKRYSEPRGDTAARKGGWMD